MAEDSNPQDLRRDDRSVSLSPTSTLYAEEESMDVDDPDALMWGDIDDSTPAVETWVPSAFFHRLKKIFSYVDTLNARFNVGDVPKNCAWGTGLHASLLAWNGQILHIWAVGHLKCMWFYATEEDSRPRVRIALDLLRNVDTAGVRRLMGMATVVPRNSWLSSIDFCADVVGRTDRRFFRDIYDATETYSAKTSMRKLQPTDLTIGDVLLVECSLVRNSVDCHGAPAAGWSAWTTTFQLASLSVLASREGREGEMAAQVDGSEVGFDHQM